MKLLETLIGILTSSAMLGIEEARRQARQIYWRLLFGVLGLIGLAFLGLGLNYQEADITNMILMLVLVVATFAVWLDTDIVFTIAGIESVLGIADKAMRDRVVAEVKKVFTDGWYMSVLKNFLVGLTVLFYILSTTHFKDNPKAFYGLLDAIIVMGVLIWRWPVVFAGHKGKKIAFGYAAIMAVYWALSLVPGPVWVKYAFGWDPTTLVPTKTEAALYRFNKAVQARADKSQAEKVDAVTEKIDEGKELAAADVQAIVDAQQAEAKGKHGSQLARRGCPEYKSGRPETCLVVDEGVLLSTTEAMHEGEFQLCNVHPDEAKFEAVWVSSSTVKVRSLNGPFLMKYELLRNADLVGGKCPDRL